MQVGLLIYGSLDTLSGGYLYDRLLVEYLRRQGHQVEIISLPWRNYFQHLGDNFSASLSRRLRGCALDILLQDELNHPSLFWINRRLAEQVKYPILTIVHHLRSSETRPAWKNHFYRWIEYRYLDSPDGFIFNSQTTRLVVESQTRIGRPYIVAYPGGDRLRPTISEEEIAIRGMKTSPLRLLFLGNVIPRKGLHTLLTALTNIPQETWTLCVAGSLEMDRPYANWIKRQVKAARLEDRVQFSGPLDEAALIAQMCSSHVLVVPSSYEGFGIAYLEGMGFGLPAIASTAGAAREIITHGVDGYLIEPGDTHALSQHLHYLTNHRQALVAMSLAARRRYHAHPTWEQSNRQIEQFLITMLEEGQRNA